MIAQIAKYGEAYRERYLEEIKTNRVSLEDDWFEALKYFFGASFFRGRRNEISQKFLDGCIQALESYFGTTSVKRSSTLNRLKREGWLEDWGHKQNPIQKALKEKGVNNEKDRRMAIETLGFITALKDKNIVNFAVAKMRSNATEEAYNSLLGIYCIGPKVTSLFFRDLVSIFNLEEIFTDSDLRYTQPVDTWVRKLYQKIGIQHEEIIPECRQLGVSPISFSQGAWYIGFHAFDVMLEMLDKA